MKAIKTKSSPIKTRFALFCDYALISSDGKLSIIGEFDQIFSPQERPFLSKGFLVASFQGKATEKSEIKVSLIDEDKKEILPSRVIGIEFGPSDLANVFIEISGLVFEHFGTYKAVFEIGKEVIGEARLRVLRVQQTTQGNS